MKFAGLLTLIISASAWLQADEAPLTQAPAAPAFQPMVAPPAPATVPKPSDRPADAQPAKISPELAQQLSSVLPKYAPPPPEPEKPKPLDADVLELPKMTIHKPRPRLRLTDDVVMTTKAFNEKLAHESMSALDRNVLNKFSLPSWLGGQSAEDRARDEYERRKRDELAQQVSDLAKVVEVVDPAQAKALRDAASKP